MRMVVVLTKSMCGCSKGNGRKVSKITVATLPRLAIGCVNSPRLVSYD